MSGIFQPPVTGTASFTVSLKTFQSSPVFFRVVAVENTFINSRIKKNDSTVADAIQSPGTLLEIIFHK